MGPDIFYRNGTIRMFCNYLMENDSSRRKAVQTGAEAFYVWRRMDPEKTLKGLIDEEALDHFLETFGKKLSPSVLIKYFESMVEFIVFLMEKEYLVKNDIESARRIVEKMARTVECLQETEGKEDDFLSLESKQSEQSDIGEDCHSNYQHNRPEKSKTVNEDYNPFEQEPLHRY